MSSSSDCESLDSDTIVPEDFVWLLVRDENLEVVELYIIHKKQRDSVHVARPCGRPSRMFTVFMSSCMFYEHGQARAWVAVLCNQRKDREFTDAKCSVNSVHYEAMRPVDAMDLLCKWWNINQEEGGLK